jgi:hypothetical protein
MESIGAHRRIGDNSEIGCGKPGTVTILFGTPIATLEVPKTILQIIHFIIARDFVTEDRHLIL